MSENSPVNKEELMERLDNDMELLEELIFIFEEDALDHLDTIEKAISEKDFESLERSAHSLKGSAKNMSANSLADIAFLLEKAGRESSLDTAEADHATLKEEFNRVVPALKAFIE